MKNKLLVLIALLFVIIGYGQGAPLPVNIQSPNTASLGKYGDVPISYYTGTPNISVPLYSINDRGIPLNISLSYDGSGVRVNSMPTWVGQNWSLNAGGVIARTVRNIPDETSITNGTTTYGYFYYESIENERLELSVDDSLELESDIFTFNFMGHTGKFFLHKDGVWKVSSASNLKITINEDDFTYPFYERWVPFVSEGGCERSETSKSIYKIMIEDDKGNTYTFGNNDTAVEYSTNFFGESPGGHWIADSWYITEVKDKLGNIIYTFDYERENYIASFYESIVDYSQSIKLDSDSSPYNCSSFSFGTLHPYHGRLISPVYLKQLNMQKDTITFNRAISYGKSYLDDTSLFSEIIHNDIIEGVCQPYIYLKPYIVNNNLKKTFSTKIKWQKLESIIGLSKNIQLTYNETELFQGGDNERLNLMKVDINDQVYSFEYNNITGLPTCLSKKIDHWGYYDGSYSFTEGLDSPSSYYSQRETHHENVKKGSLIKITYPTKGWTEFVWEANSYSGYVSDDKSAIVDVTNTLAGGLRIQQIRDNDAKGNEEVRTFKYLQNFDTDLYTTTSSGILENKPKYYWGEYSLRAGEVTYTKSNLFSRTSFIPLANFFGSHIGYSEVIEEYSDGSHITYKYTSNKAADKRDEFPNFSGSTPYIRGNDRSLLRGHLTNVSVFKSFGDLLEKTSYQYDFDADKFATCKFFKSYFCDSHEVSIWHLYKLYYFDYNMLSAKKETVTNTGSIVDETNYTWSDFSNSENIGDTFMTSKTTQTYLTPEDPNSKHLTELYYYTFNYPWQPYTDMKNKRLLNRMDTQVWNTNIKMGETKVEYDYFTIDNTQQILPKGTWKGYKDHDLEQDIIFDQYDSKGNLIEYHKKDGATSCLIWGYNQKYIIAKIENAAYSDLSSLVSTLQNASDLDEDNCREATCKEQLLREELDKLRDSGLNPNLERSMITSYTYDLPLGLITSITDSKGLTQYYEYDSNNRLKFVKDAEGKILSKNEYHYKN